VLETREFLERLDQSLQELPLDQKTAFVLAEIEQFSYAEIARIENVSLGTVKSRVHRAKQRLRSALQTFVRES
jgi:RNA polymerase sigma-70 factor (ECF subfamily)